MATISGTNVGNVLTGTLDDDIILGLSGNDVITDPGGFNRIDGQDGDDTITGGVDLDYIAGGPGNDTIYGAGGFDQIIGEAGNDTIYGQDGNDYAAGNPGEDVLYGGQGDDFLVGEQGFDLVFGEDGNDFVAGGEDDDIVHGDNGDDLVDGDLGNDSLYGDAGNDTVFGDFGNDRMWGGTGTNTLDGAVGVDTAVFEFSFAEAGVVSSGTLSTITGSNSVDTVKNTEVFEFSDRSILQADGNAAVDDLFYLSQYRDVYQNGNDAEQHFRDYGWKEGRDPNAFFDTKGYLAAYADVAAEGIDPSSTISLMAGRRDGIPRPSSTPRPISRLMATSRRRASIPSCTTSNTARRGTHDLQRRRFRLTA